MKIKELMLFESGPNDYLLSPILGLGKVNLKTGSSKYFNVYDNWGEDTTYEIWEKLEGGYVIVVTSGKEPYESVGTVKGFKGDQTGRFLFRAKMVDHATGTALKQLATKYGSSITGYTYK